MRICHYGYSDMFSLVNPWLRISNDLYREVRYRNCPFQKLRRGEIFAHFMFILCSVSLKRFLLCKKQE